MESVFFFLPQTHDGGISESDGSVPDSPLISAPSVILGQNMLETSGLASDAKRSKSKFTRKEFTVDYYKNCLWRKQTELCNEVKWIWWYGRRRCLCCKEAQMSKKRRKKYVYRREFCWESALIKRPASWFLLALPNKFTIEMRQQSEIITS